MSCLFGKGKATKELLDIRGSSLPFGGPWGRLESLEALGGCNCMGTSGMNIDLVPVEMSGGRG